MTRYVLVFVLLGSTMWGQAANPTSTQTPERPNPPAMGGPAGNAPAAGNQPDMSKFPPDTPVLTINGLCDNPPADKSDTSDCKTVVTRDQFEKLIGAIQPLMPPRARRQFATRYADALVKAQRAHALGLDHGEQYELHMQLMRVQVLAQALNQHIQEEASQISDADIADYYKQNAAEYQEIDLQRIFVPFTQTLPPSKVKLSEAAEQKRSKAAESAMKTEANTLHKRAVAGESFRKLQAEAFALAGVKSKAPTTTMEKTRVSGLPPSQVSVMDLKNGEVSAVFADQSGYFIYKAGEKNTLPLADVKEEIRGTLRTKRMQEDMQAVQRSGKTTLNDAYFGPEGPGGMMRPPMPTASQPAPAAGPK